MVQIKKRYVVLYAIILICVAFITVFLGVLYAPRQESKASPFESVAQNYTKFLGDPTGWLSGDRTVISGDVNGDEITDLVLGDWAATKKVYILFGPINSTVSQVDLNNASSYNLTLLDIAPDYNEMAIGDVNGDNKGDLVIAQADTVYVFFSTLINTLAGNGTGTAVSITSNSNYNVKYKLSNNVGRGYAKRSGLTVKDITQDGKSDLIISDPDFYWVEPLTSHTFSSRNVLIASTLLDDFNSSTGTSIDLTNPSTNTNYYSAIIGGPTNYNHFDAMPGIDDFDGDGQNDIIYTASQYLYFVNSTLLQSLTNNFTTPGARIWLGDTSNYSYRLTVAAGSGFGYTYAVLGDLTGDNKPEIVFGANSGDDYVYVLDSVKLQTAFEESGLPTGASFDLTTIASIEIKNSRASTVLGVFENILIDDFNNDGQNDIIIGEQYDNPYEFFFIDSSILRAFVLANPSGGVLELTDTANYTARYTVNTPCIGNQGEIYLEDVIGNSNKDFILGSYCWSGYTGALWIIDGDKLIANTTTGNVYSLNSDPDSYSVFYEGTGASSFFSGYNAIVIEDLNNDGVNDLYVAEPSNTVAYIVWGALPPTPTPTNTPTPTAPPTSTPSPSPTVSLTPTPTNMLSPTPTATHTPISTISPSSIPSVIPTTSPIPTAESTTPVTISTPETQATPTATPSPVIRKTATPTIKPEPISASTTTDNTTVPEVIHSIRGINKSIIAFTPKPFDEVLKTTGVPGFIVIVLFAIFGFKLWKPLLSALGIFSIFSGNKPRLQILDSESNDPVVFARLIIIDQAKNLVIKRAISNFNGEILAILNKGDYLMEVEKRGYEFFKAQINITVDNTPLSGKIRVSPAANSSVGSMMTEKVFDITKLYFLVIIAFVFAIINLFIQVNWFSILILLVTTGVLILPLVQKKTQPIS